MNGTLSSLKELVTALNNAKLDQNTGMSSMTSEIID